MNKILVIAKYDVVAAAKGHVLFRNAVEIKEAVAFSKEEAEGLAMCSAEVALEMLNNKIEGIARERFVTKLRSDLTVRRMVGGTKWTVKTREVLYGRDLEDITENARRNIVRSTKEREYNDKVRIEDLTDMLYKHFSEPETLDQLAKIKADTTAKLQEVLAA